MGLKAKWTMTCDGYGCNITVEKERRPEDGEYVLQPDGVQTYYTDMWGFGIPDGWLQLPHDDVTGKDYLFFHSAECYKEWLKHQGRYQELDEFENAVWIA